MPDEVSLRELADRFGGAGAAFAIGVDKAGPRLAVAARGGVMRGFQTETTPAGNPWLPLAHKRPRGGSKVLQETGGLKAGISSKWDAGAVELRANHPGANVHQFGAIIRAKPGKALAIPVSKAAALAGRPRFFKGQLKPFGRPPGGGLLEERTGRTGRKLSPVVHFLFVQQVRIPKREYLGFSAETQQTILRLAGDAGAAEVVKRFGVR